jgi:hypothetical protein
MHEERAVVELPKVVASRQLGHRSGRHRLFGGSDVRTVRARVHVDCVYDGPAHRWHVDPCFSIRRHAVQSRTAVVPELWHRASQFPLGNNGRET